MTERDQHTLALEMRAAMANARMCPPMVAAGVEMAVKHVAHAFYVEDARFDFDAFYDECGLTIGPH